MPPRRARITVRRGFSALQRAEIAEIITVVVMRFMLSGFSALQRAEIAEIPARDGIPGVVRSVSVLFNEPKLLKCDAVREGDGDGDGFSALQRAEIAEMYGCFSRFAAACRCFSALQRAEIAEIGKSGRERPELNGFSALQRAEIAEISTTRGSAKSASRFQCSSTSRNC